MQIKIHQYLFLIFLVSFPKAGIVFSGIPITVNLVVFSFIALVIFLEKKILTKSQYGLFLIFLTGWTLLVINRSELLLNSNSAKFGVIYWLLIIPLMWILFNEQYRNSNFASIEFLIIAFTFTSLYGVQQYLFGLESMKVEGLTIAYGDSYSRKNLALAFADNSQATKIPSTFQGGNIWGQSFALILVWVIHFRIWRYVNLKALKLLSVLSPTVGVYLSFSRTALMAAFFGILLSFLSLSNIRRYFLMPTIVTTFFIFFAISQSSNRYSFESFTNSAGRTNQWKNGIQSFGILDWIFGNPPRFDGVILEMEGLLGLLAQVGLVGFGYLVWLWLKIFPVKFNVIGLTLLLCIFLDSTYVSPPLLEFPILLLIMTPNKLLKRS